MTRTLLPSGDVDDTKMLSRLSSEATAAAARHPWPGYLAEGIACSIER
jgi:hypothetical protein